MLRESLKISVSAMVLLTAAAGVHAAESTPIAADASDASAVFTLGQIEQVTITGALMAQAISETSVSSEEIYTFNTLTLDRVLDLVPGASSSNLGGSRNERLIFVRGFDRFQVPLTIDGIRVYLPADNRLDFGFFLTSDLAEVQVQKGYVSVLNGPGALGGQINLVTRKPVEPFQWEARAGTGLAGDGSYNGYSTSGMVGGRTDRFYWLASGAVTDVSRFKLSEDFTPTSIENGGFRDHSSISNYRVNAKFGWTPNATDEYSLSYTGQWGEKEAPLHVSDPLVANTRYWTWPYWDVQSIYFLSNTALGENAYVQTKFYYNSFENALFSYDNANYNTQTLGKAFRSYYDDFAYGGSIEFGWAPVERDTLKGAFFYRRDNHKEWQILYPSGFQEPNQTSVEDTYSLALENRFRITDRVDFVTGVSYDWRNVLQAEDFTGSSLPGNFIAYTTADSNATNGQAALIYAYSGTGSLYANVSNRTRFPTIFERFSSRFGTTLSNPSLKAERAINYEIGAGDVFFETTRVDASVFYSDVTDAIVSVPIVFCDTTSAVTPPNCTGANGAPGRNTNTNQSQNVGDGNYYGFEFSVDSRITEALQAGVRFTYTRRDLNAQDPSNPPLPGSGLFHQTGLPYSQVFAYATYDVLPRLSITPSVLAASDRWTSNTSGSLYYKTGSFVLVNLQLDFQLTEKIDIAVGGRNLFDENYILTDGFPEEGRSFFLNLRIRS